MSDLLQEMKAWIGREETRVDIITPRLAQAYVASVGGAASSGPGDAVPAGLHWCLSTPDAPMAELSADGHPEKGGFLPPIPAPRRMWAGGELEFDDQLLVGDTVERVSRIEDVTLKEGRSGTLWFVKVSHSHRTVRGEAISEVQDIVYRDAAKTPAVAGRAAPEPTAFDAALAVDASPTLLFRYSALTFNAHRIHYDRPYAQDVEGYPGLVVHGPLQASLLLRLATEMLDGTAPKRFSFRGLAPLIDGGTIDCRGRWSGENQCDLWTGLSQESPHMQAQASW